ncbi:JmjC domain-containing protein [Ilumatobacter coccineus]|uniref:JmjC domain-containing protein n=1 Tax=Ilumatobacter coccineus (strain NBRC 103263 / KCTC 29153 / YM16-304) TaxID=1313172 RepID=A0A6C7E9Z4_ILUCY|nr:hypothetical protein YM304_32330 [Ilumatobacter coccineus YM16-304]
MVRDGQPIAAEKYTERARLGGWDLRDVIAPDRVAEQFAAGATVVAQSLHRTHPTVRSFVDDLRADVSHPLQANAYLTPPNSTGLAPHSDRHDVIVLQLEGSKQWAVDGLGEFELRPGDVLYVPAGHEHAATSTERSSLHLTIGLLRVTHRAVIERVLRSAPSTLDDPLPLRYADESDDPLVASIDAALADVRTHLESVVPSEVARTERRRRSTSTTSARRPLTAAIALQDLDGAATVVRAGSPWTTTRPDDSTIRVEADGRRLTAPRSCERALALVRTGDGARVDELPGLDHDSRVLLARRLVSTGLCRLLER